MTEKFAKSTENKGCTIISACTTLTRNGVFRNVIFILYVFFQITMKLYVALVVAFVAGLACVSEAEDANKTATPPAPTAAPTAKPTPKPTEKTEACEMPQKIDDDPMPDRKIFETFETIIEAKFLKVSNKYANTCNWFGNCHSYNLCTLRSSGCKHDTH